MAVQIHLIQLLPLLFAAPLALQLSTSEGGVPLFAFSWPNDNNTFQAGEVASINIKVLGEFDSSGAYNKSAFSPRISVDGKMGNSCFVSGVLLDFAGDTDSWRILFTPIRVGVFNVLIEDNPFKVFDSSLHFYVVPGKIYPSVCIASWMNIVNEFEAGEKATVLIVPRDAFWNNVSSTSEDLNPFNFTVSELYENGSIDNVPNITHIGWNELGLITMEFIATKVGRLLLRVEGGNQTLHGSPLPFKVYPGPVDVFNCVAEWKVETDAWQIFSKMEIFIHQKDQYGNPAPGFYEFDADVVEKETNLSSPLADLRFEKVMPGIQLCSFSLLEPGDFLLVLSDMKHNRSISNMPFAFNVFIGYADGSASIVNGSGLNGSSTAGEISQFSLYLIDVFQYPSFVGAQSIRARIARENDSYLVQPSIYPIINGSVAQKLNYGAAIGASEIAPGPSEVVPAPSVDLRNTSTEHSKMLASAFDVIYVPAKIGFYEIYVLCGNILLNGGRLFRRQVIAGAVNTSLSGIVEFSSKVSKMTKNEIVVQLVDSFSNPVLSQQSRINLEIASINRSGFSVGKFVDNNDGTYTGHYLVKDVGTYEMCVSFEGKRMSPCPFGVYVYGGKSYIAPPIHHFTRLLPFTISPGTFLTAAEYFPKAYDDSISVWEDESIAFDVLANDYFASGNASVVEFSNPERGSLLQYGHLFRYTPYKDYYGNDFFTYTISDVNGNLASAAVKISVLNIPPQFISFPSELQATEDVISPRCGGFPGVEVKYSDPMENISVTLSARLGTVFLYPMPMQFWKPNWAEFSAKRGDDAAKPLILEGCVEAINLALQSIQYLGNENFYGNDTIHVSASNMNGKNDLNIPVFVEPVNDPPFIKVPKYIILKSHEDELLLFDKYSDKYEFPVGDPDVLGYPGNDSQFTVLFSMEVDDGSLETILSAELIRTTELMVMSSYQWQPLQTYISVSQHFKVQANGVRFRGSLNDCNSALQHMKYLGGEHGAVLTMKLNDMGHYGYSGFDDNISRPLYAEAKVNLIRRRPMTSLSAHTLGTAIAVEFLLVFCLGLILLFFMCKCTTHLINERARRNVQNSQLSNVQKSQKKTASTDLSDDTTNFTGCYSSPFFLRGQHSNFRQRSNRRLKIEEPDKDKSNPIQSSSSHWMQTPPSLMPLAIEKEQNETI